MLSHECGYRRGQIQDARIQAFVDDHVTDEQWDLDPDIRHEVEEYLDAYISRQVELHLLSGRLNEVAVTGLVETGLLGAIELLLGAYGVDSRECDFECSTELSRTGSSGCVGSELGPVILGRECCLESKALPNTPVLHVCVLASGKGIDAILFRPWILWNMEVALERLVPIGLDWRGAFQKSGNLPCLGISEGFVSMSRLGIAAKL